MLLSFRRDGVTYHASCDALASVRLVTDEEGEVVSRFDYSGYGTLLEGSFDGVPGGMPYTWVGGLGCRQDPSSGLVYMRARWYDPTNQRFASRDPLGNAATDNLYGYAAQSPTTKIDPFGLWEWTSHVIPANDARTNLHAFNMRLKFDIRNQNTDWLATWAMVSMQGTLPEAGCGTIKGTISIYPIARFEEHSYVFIPSTRWKKGYSEMQRKTRYASGEKHPATVDFETKLSGVKMPSKTFLNPGGFDVIPLPGGPTRPDLRLMPEDVDLTFYVHIKARGTVNNCQIGKLKKTWIVDIDHTARTEWIHIKGRGAGKLPPEFGGP